MTIKQTVFRVLTIIWAIIIFSFSARSGDISTADSNRVGMTVGRIVVPHFIEWSNDRQVQFAQKIDYPVRKTAHASEYAILGILLVGAEIYYIIEKYLFSERKQTSKLYTNVKLYILPWLIGTLYAVSDEFHQLFVPGRSCQVTDVMIDSMGVIVGIIFIVVIDKVYGFLKKQKYNS